MSTRVDVYISGSIKNEKWEKVYEDTLKIIRAFDLATVDEYSLAVQKVRTVMKAKELTGDRPHWSVSSDFTTLTGGEEYRLYRSFKEYFPQREKDANYAIYGVSEELALGENRHGVLRIWGGNTKGAPYTLAMLCCAAVLESELGNECMVCGDISLEECKIATENAKTILKKDISLPRICDMEALYEAIYYSELKNKVELFLKLYIGQRDTALGSFLGECFSDDEITTCFTKLFSMRSIGSFGFDTLFRQYVAMGLDLNRMGAMFKFSDELTREIRQKNALIKTLINMGLHIENKQKVEDLRAAVNMNMVSGVSRSAGGSEIIKRYIPLEELTCLLENALGDKAVNVAHAVKEYAQIYENALNEVSKDA